MKTLADLSEEEFDLMLDNMSKPEYDALTSEEFFKILAAIDAADSLELTARVENGQLVFEQPAPLPVNLNSILIGTKRIVIKLRPRC
ncbi:hypothetical protein L0337_35285 [candidate division KSB1 bacterium]|nr:hypothetical protein [candidate division KSB1 bacterium]